MRPFCGYGIWAGSNLTDSDNFEAATDSRCTHCDLSSKLKLGVVLVNN